MTEVAEIIAVVEKRICSRCKCLLKLDASTFKTNKHGDYNKTCIKCSERVKASKIANKCEHNREKSICKDCGGSSICEHDKQKRQCRECNGSSFCIHDKFKAQCRECNGSSFCIHDKRKSKCRDCNGSEFCMHDIRKSFPSSMITR